MYPQRARVAKNKDLTVKETFQDLYRAMLRFSPTRADVPLAAT